MSTKNFLSLVCRPLLFSLAFILLNSCNVLKEITNGKTELKIKGEPLFKGLVAFWNFNDLAGAGSPQTSSVPTPNNFTLVTSTGSDTISTMDGIKGLALSCPGSGFSVNSSQALNVSTLDAQGFTFSFWFRENGYIASNLPYIILKNAGGDELHRVEFYYQPWAIDMTLNNILHTTPTNSLQNFSDALNWHHVTFTVSPGTPDVELYIDGVYVASMSDNTSYSDTVIHSIGLCPIGSSSLLLDSIGLWARVLPQQEIWDLYSGQNPLD